MAAKKTNQTATDTQDPKAGEDPKQQELGQGGQSETSDQAAGNPNDQTQQLDTNQDPDPAKDPESGKDPEPGTDPETGPDQGDDEDRAVLVLVDHNPLGLKCGSVATVSGADARRLEQRGIVDRAEEAVARGKAAQSKSNRGDQVIEDDD